MTSELIWLIFLLPVFSFVIISFFIRPFVKRESKVAGYITIAAITGSLALSLWTLSTVLAAPNHELEVPYISWLAVGDLNIHLGVMVDSLTAVMLVVVTVVSLMVQIYSQGYMKGDPGYHRYYAWMSLFTASMLGVVMADNLLLVFVFWELVGLCSYLLIGFWFHRPSAANAAKKAFIVTRLGDFGFLAAILLLFTRTGTFDIAELYGLAGTAVLAGATLTWVAIGIFSGAVGKSAQFPLHVWLPDAMEGPTPVSALIHAATMVAAGVFLVARTLPIFVHSIEAVTTVAIIGGVTAIFAATMALVMNDIKRVLAYSTISQLGYMMLGLGVAGMAAYHSEGGSVSVEVAKAATAIGIFHLFNHAFFKALLFMGAGSVNHATGTFDMRLMGGLRRVMPWTYATFLIATLSLAGIWPLSGFWSKDEILAVALENHPVLGILAVVTVFITAFYMFRVIYMTFHGEYRGGASSEHGSKEASHPHESPGVMVIPMVVLAVLSVASGLWNVTGHFGLFFGPGEQRAFFEGFFSIYRFDDLLPWISLIIAGLGILLAYAMYSRKLISPERIGSMFKPLHTLLIRKYFFDDLYENVIVKISLIGGLFAGLEYVDGTKSEVVGETVSEPTKNFWRVDGIVNGVASGAIAGGRAIRRAQTGQLQLYGLVIGIGILAIILCLYFFG